MPSRPAVPTIDAVGTPPGEPYGHREPDDERVIIPTTIYGPGRPSGPPDGAAEHGSPPGYGPSPAPDSGPPGYVPPGYVPPGYGPPGAGPQPSSGAPPGYGPAPHGSPAHGSAYGPAAHNPAPQGPAGYGPAAHGSAPYGPTAQGAGTDGPSYGPAARGPAAQGPTAYGSAPYNPAAQGGATNGSAYDSARYGPAAYGSAPYGPAAQGAATDDSAYGPARYGPAAQGRAAYGSAPYGPAARGAATDGPAYDPAAEGRAPQGPAAYGSGAYGPAQGPPFRGSAGPGHVRTDGDPGYPGPAAFRPEHRSAPGPGGPGPGRAAQGRAGQDAEYGDPGASAAPYRAASPQGYRPGQAPYGPGQAPFGETVNGGSYARVIREDEPTAPPGSPRPARPPRPSGPQRQQPARGDAGPGPRAPGNRPLPSAEPSRHPDLPSGSGAPVFGYRDASPPGQPGQLAVTGPSVVFGPDDPAYGPPSPDWYTRDERADQQAAEEIANARGPFEPLENPGGSGRELVSYQPVGYETPGGAGTKSLDQIRDFYRAAEEIDPGDLGQNFGELLERQRQLISEYFTQTARRENQQ